MTAQTGPRAPAHGFQTESSIFSVLGQFAGMQVVLAGAGIVRNKVVAHRLGPTAFGELAQIGIVTSTICTLVCLGMTVAVSRNTAIARTNEERQGQLASANGLVMTLAALACGTSTLFLLSGRLLPAAGLAGGSLAVAATGIFIAGIPIEALKNNYLAFLQGLLDVRALALRRSLAVLLATAVALPLVWFLGFIGAALQYVVLGAFVAILLGIRCRQLGYAPLRLRFDGRVMVGLASFGVASLASGFAQSFGDTVVRASLIHTVGATSNGYLQAAYVLSQTVKGIVLASIGSVSLATIAGQRDRGEMSAAVDRLLNVVVPGGTAALGLLGLLGSQALALLYSGAFVRGAEVFPFLLSADLLMVFVWVVGTPLLVFGDRVLWLVLELLFAALRWGIAVLLLGRYGMTAVALAYLAAASIHAALNLAIFRLRYRLHVRWAHVVSLLVGMALLASWSFVGSRACPPALVTLAGGSWLGFAIVYAHRAHLAAGLQQRFLRWRRQKGW